MKNVPHLSRRAAFCVLLFALVGIGGGAIAFSARASIASFVWHTFHVFPAHTVMVSGDSQLSLSVGNYYFNVGGDGAYDLKRARAYYDKALVLEPETPEALYQLTRIDFLEGRFGSALLKINRYIDTFGNEPPQVYYLRGLIYGYSGALTEAADDFVRFLEYRPYSWAGYNDLAWVYFKIGDYESAKKAAQTGLSYNPDNPWLLNSYGVSLLNTGSAEEAAAVFTEALAEAEKLNEADWAAAYPGNDPRMAEAGLTAIVQAIAQNAERAVD